MTSLNQTTFLETCQTSRQYNSITSIPYSGCIMQMLKNWLEIGIKVCSNSLWQSKACYRRVSYMRTEYTGNVWCVNFVSSLPFICSHWTYRSIIQPAKLSFYCQKNYLFLQFITHFKLSRHHQVNIIQYVWKECKCNFVSVKEISSLQNFSIVLTRNAV
jgi:hypothetical protein